MSTERKEDENKTVEEIQGIEKKIKRWVFEEKKRNWGSSKSIW